MPLKDHVYWIDANLPPKVATWLEVAFDVKCEHFFFLNLISGSDDEIFDEARKSGNNIIIITKDEDFTELVMRRKPPPSIIWVTVGNLSNNQLKTVLINNLETAVQYLESSEYFFVEIT